MKQSTNPGPYQPSSVGITTAPGRSPVTIPDINTRFALPIVCPKTGERVSAETLYNRCCADLGYVVRDHVGDLIFDNLDYSADETVCSTDASNEALHDAIYAWAGSVRAQIALPTYEEALADPTKARALFDASKGGNVRGITEDHRYQLANVIQRAASAARLTEIDRQTLAHALICTQNAVRDLGMNAGDGPKARPTVASLNRTMERLASIQRLLEQVLA